MISPDGAGRLAALRKIVSSPVSLRCRGGAIVAVPIERNYDGGPGVAAGERVNNGSDLLRRMSLLPLGRRSSMLSFLAQWSLTTIVLPAVCFIFVLTPASHDVLPFLAGASPVSCDTR